MIFVLDSRTPMYSSFGQDKNGIWMAWHGWRDPMTDEEVYRDRWL